jgi:hypothetical protein
MEMPQPFACYRHYNAAGELLYVGVTASTGKRDSGHKSGSEWFGEIVRSECTYFATRREALVFEAACIIVDEPKYNKWSMPSYCVGRTAMRSSTSLRMIIVM